MTIRIIIRTEGLSEAAKAYSSVEIGKIIQNRFDQAARLLYRSHKKEAPQKTGKLRKSQYMKRVGPLHYIIGERDPGAKYGPAVRLGARPHPIEPRVKQAIFFPGLKRPIRRVKRHPGITRPVNYPLEAVDLALPGITKILERVSDDIEEL